MSQAKASFVVVQIYFVGGEFTNQIVESRAGTADQIRLLIRERDEHFANGSLFSEDDTMNSLIGDDHVSYGRYIFIVSISGGNAYRTALEERELASMRHRTQLSNAKRVSKANSMYFHAEESADVKISGSQMLNAKIGSKLEESGSDSGSFGSLTSGERTASPHLDE